MKPPICSFHIPLALAGLLSCSQLLGCSGGAASTAPVNINQADLKRGEITRANQVLDNMEKLPPESRQAMAGVGRTADTLKKASTDPAVKARIDSLGIHLK